MIARYLILAVVVLATARSLRSAAPETPPPVELANAWREGQPIPEGLLEYREPDGCLVSTTDSIGIFPDIENYPLLQKIMSMPCDARIFQFAASRALYLVGPSRFFGDLQKVYATHPELLAEKHHSNLNQLSRKRHVLVDGIFVSDEDMPRDQAEAMFIQITNELRGGAAFAAVRRRYQGAYEYTYFEKADDGTKLRLTLTGVGNYGDYVLTDTTRDAGPFRSAEMPQAQADQLLKRKKGDIIVLRDEPEKQTMLYQVLDVYTPSL